MTLCGGFNSLALVVLGAGPAVSPPTAVSVELDAPAGCADPRGFFDRVRARTDRVRAARPGEEALKIQVRLVRNGAKVQGELRFKQDTSESATRRVDGASCDEVVGVLSLTAALALERMNPPPADTTGASGGNTAAGSGSERNTAEGGDAARDDTTSANGGNSASSGAGGDTAQKTNSDATNTAGKSATPVENTDDPAHSAPGEKSRFPIRFELGAELGIAEVLSPFVSAGAGAFGRVRYARTVFGLSAMYWSNGLTNPDSSTEARAVLLGLSACPISFPLGSRATVEPCALVNAGWLHVADSSAVNSRDANRSFWGLGALGRARLPVTPLVGFELEAGFTLPLVERRFVTTRPQRIVAETPWISSFVGLAAVVSP
ncbi:MAG: hypothetical protein ACOY0T_36960 [Myxococcota bacterium]